MLNTMETKTVKNKKTNDPLTAVFQALADPTRRSILEQLSTGKATVKELARPFAITLPAITKHLKILEKAGLIERGRKAQWRPCQIQAKPLKDASDWIDQYRRHWEESLERLDHYLQKLQKQNASKKGNKDDKRK